MNALWKKSSITILIIAIFALAQACTGITVPGTDSSSNGGVVAQVSSGKPVTAPPKNIRGTFQGHHSENLPASMLRDTEKDIRELGLPINEDNFLKRVTPPPPERIIPVPEWHEARYLFLAYPPSDLVTSETNDLYVSLMREVGEYVDILILVGDDNQTSVNQLRSLLKAEGLHHLVEDRTVQFITTELDSRWVQDYLQLWALGESGRLYSIDPIYVDPVREEEDREGDDVAPSYIHKWFFERGERSIPIRPPLVLSGGDFATDGDCICFTSTHTLLANGSNEDIVNSLFQRYFGCSKVIYLRPLPGPTVQHIDMIMKIVDSNTILVGQYDSPEDVNSQTWYLQQEAKEALDDNVRILQDSLKEIKPDLKILRMPMPDIVWKENAEIEAGVEERLKDLGIAVIAYLDRQRLRRIEITMAEKKLLEALYPAIMALEIPNKEELLGKIAPLIGRRFTGQRSNSLISWLPSMPLFHAKDLEFSKQLDKGKFPDGLRQAFEKNKLSLSENIMVSVKTEAREWLIADKANKQTYVAKRQGDSVAVYNSPETDSTPTVVELKPDQARIQFVRSCAELLDIEEEIEAYLQMLFSIDFYDYYYPTFLNSTFVQTRNQRILLVPRYSSFEEMESEVTRLYQQVYPDTKIIFINSDFLITQHGAIHCITKTRLACRRFEPWTTSINDPIRRN